MCFLQTTFKEEQEWPESLAKLDKAQRKKIMQLFTDTSLSFDEKRKRFETTFKLGSDDVNIITGYFRILESYTNLEVMIFILDHSKFICC